jgi:hypothetical protein
MNAISGYGGCEVRSAMFLFFSNRLGCLGSIAVSLLGTLLVLWLMGWL